MENVTPLTRLTPAEVYKLHVQKVRRNAAIERQAKEIQADVARVQALYTEGSTRKAAPAPEPAFTEATTYKVTRLPGGASLSGRKGRAPKDTSPEAEAKRARRRERRAARKARQAAST